MTIALPWPFRGYTVAPSSDPAAGLQVARQPSTAAILHHYAAPGIPPPSARVDSKLKLQARRPIRMWHLWKYGMVVVSKATELTGDVLSYHIYGPKKKSWGIEMTVINSLMRGVGRHSALVDIGTIRMLMSIGGLVPLPSDALVTPVTFRVRRRRLRGLLEEFDAAETGTRELSGEWVVGKKTWHRLQTEWKAAQAGPKPTADAPHTNTKSHKKKERVILYIHGGAYYLSSAAAQRLISIPLAKYTDCRVFALDYRLAPETKFPGPLHDVVTGYFRLVEDLHIPPENIILAGDSAGGGLTLALLMYLRDNAYPLPSGAILMSPWVDLTLSCESWESNAQYDVVPFPALDDYMNPVGLYLGDQLERYLTHPYASPLFGDFKGLPPLLIQAGDAEVLRDEITLLAHKASLAGVDVRHELYEDAIHVFQLYPFLESASQSFMSMREFVHVLPQLRSPQTLDSTAEKVLEIEIDNEAATLVRGDGVEVVTGKEEVEQELQEEGEATETSDSDEEGREETQKEFPSWRPTKSWSILGGDEDDEEEDGDEDEDEERPPTPRGATTPTKSRHRADTAPSIPGFRRIRSAISLIIPDATPTPPIPHVRHHKRTQSYHHDSGRITGAGMSNQFARATRPTHINLPPPQPLRRMSSMHSLPPSPSIRRSSNASHPDISYLVQNWTDSGPANQTLMYKPPHRA